MNDFGFTATTPDKKCGNDKERSQMAENLLQVNIFFQSLNVQTITEMPKYPVSHVRNCVHINQRIFLLKSCLLIRCFFGKLSFSGSFPIRLP